MVISISAGAQNHYVINYKPKPSRIEKTNYKSDLDYQLTFLSKSIIKDKKDDGEKVKAIYDWITQHLSYDYELRFSKKLQKEFYTSENHVIEMALKRKKALCGGFAFLFTALCEKVGLESKSIHGFTKNASNFNTPNHSWNAVKLNDKWYLLDISWSITKGTKNHPNKLWYLAKPKTFIKSHYPQQTELAFLTNPPALSSFIENL